MSSTEEQRAQDLAIAKQMGEDFAKNRGDDLLARFLCETGIIDEFYEIYSDRTKDEAVEPKRYLELMTADYRLPFHRIIAMAYSMGQMDAKEEIQANIYRPRKKSLVQGPQPSHLILPGMPQE